MTYDRYEQYLEATKERYESQSDDKAKKLLGFYPMHEMAMMWMLNDLAIAVKEINRKLDGSKEEENINGDNQAIT